MVMAAKSLCVFHPDGLLRTSPNLVILFAKVVDYFSIGRFRFDKLWIRFLGNGVNLGIRKKNDNPAICGLLIKSALKRTPAGYGSYDLLTFVTGCSSKRVFLLPPAKSSLPEVWSQVCLKILLTIAPQ